MSSLKSIKFPVLFLEEVHTIATENAELVSYVRWALTLN